MLSSFEERPSHQVTKKEHILDITLLSLFLIINIDQYLDIIPLQCVIDSDIPVLWVFLEANRRPRNII